MPNLAENGQILAKIYVNPVTERLCRKMGSLPETGNSDKAASGRSKTSVLGGVNRFVLGLNRAQKRVVLIVGDSALILLSFWLALALRYGSFSFSEFLDLGWILPVLVVAGIGVFWVLGLYKTLVRSIENRLVAIIAFGSAVLATILATAAFTDYDLFVPRSVPFIFGFVLTCLVTAFRAAGRSYYWRNVGGAVVREPVLIYGAGVSGTQLAAALQGGRDYQVLGFIDDDPTLHGNFVHGKRIYPPKRLGELIAKNNVRRVLMAIPSAAPLERRAVIDRLKRAGVRIQTVPAFMDIVSGRANPDDLVEVQIEELLGRVPVLPNPQLIQASIAGKTVMVTGAGGSIGSELCRQILSAGPKAIVLFEMSEVAIYNIEKDLADLAKLRGLGHVPVHCVLGSVTDRDHVRKVIADYQVATIYHAAAYKHVPIVEINGLEGARNNIIGTRVVAEEADLGGVERFVMVSTDKAVRPTNVMGATKRFAELVIQRQQQRARKTVYAIVRFGNVLGSSGSVIPLFRSQIHRGGPVTLTHPDIIRYFMTITEAAQLVIQAGSLAKGGELFVLDMGEPVKIHELARMMIELSGLKVKNEENPDGDVEIRIVGLRSGEKLYEELFLAEETLPTLHEKIMRANEPQVSPALLEKAMGQLEQALRSRDSAKAVQAMCVVVEDFRAVQAAS